MAVEDILKRAPRKSKKTRKHLHGVHATDERYTGSEPVWTDWQDWPVEKFASERSRAFNFYNYYLSAKDSKPAVLEWMKANGYSADEISAVRSAPDYYPGSTTGTLCICMNRGMPAPHPKMNDTDDLGFVRATIREAIEQGKKSRVKEDAKAEEASISPMVLLQKKCQRTIILDLDVMLDQWIREKRPVQGLDIYAAMQRHGLSAMACAPVERWLNAQLEELVGARDQTHPDLVEGYRYLTKAQIQDRIGALEKMLADLDKFRHAAKATRAPREKKPVSATKQIAKLQYCKQSPEFKVASIDPSRIVGCYRLLAFNTKYRVLLDYVAQNDKGLSIKGTTLQNVDETKTRAIRLRKPDEFLATALSATPKQIEKAWSKLTTKPTKPKPRINKEVVLLRVFSTLEK